MTLLNDETWLSEAIEEFLAQQTTEDWSSVEMASFILRLARKESKEDNK